MSGDPKTISESEEIDKSLDSIEEPSSLAEATTASLDEDALGGHASGSADKDDKANK